jgi:hypothetical protein
MIYSALRSIMIGIGITPPEPGNEKWVAVVFFGACAVIAAVVLLLGAYLLRFLS